MLQQSEEDTNRTYHCVWVYPGQSPGDLLQACKDSGHALAEKVPEQLWLPSLLTALHLTNSHK